MGYYIAVDTSLSMALSCGGKIPRDDEQTRFRVAVDIVDALVDKAVEIGSGDGITLFRIGEAFKTVRRWVTPQDDVVALLSKRNDGSPVHLTGRTNMSRFMTHLTSTFDLTSSDRLIIITDCSTFEGDVNYTTLCETRFIIVNTNRETMSETQLEELDEIAAQSIGHEVSQENESLYHHFFASDFHSLDELVSAVAEEMFEMSVYHLALGNLTTMVKIGNTFPASKAIAVDVIGFCKPTNLQNIECESTHFVHPCFFPEDVEVERVARPKWNVLSRRRKHENISDTEDEAPRTKKRKMDETSTAENPERKGLKLKLKISIGDKAAKKDSSRKKKGKEEEAKNEKKESKGRKEKKDRTEQKEIEIIDITSSPEKSTPEKSEQQKKLKMDKKKEHATKKNKKTTEDKERIKLKKEKRKEREEKKKEEAKKSFFPEGVFEGDVGQKSAAPIASQEDQTLFTNDILERLAMKGPKMTSKQRMLRQLNMKEEDIPPDQLSRMLFWFKGEAGESEPEVEEVLMNKETKKNEVDDVKMDVDNENEKPKENGKSSVQDEHAAEKKAKKEKRRRREARKAKKEKAKRTEKTGGRPVKKKQFIRLYNTEDDGKKKKSKDTKVVKVLARKLEKAKKTGRIQKDDKNKKTMKRRNVLRKKRFRRILRTIKGAPTKTTKRSDEISIDEVYLTALLRRVKQPFRDFARPTAPLLVQILTQALKVQEMFAICVLNNGCHAVLTPGENSEGHPFLLISVLPPRQRTSEWVPDFSKIVTGWDEKNLGADMHYDVSFYPQASYVNNQTCLLSETGWEADIGRIKKTLRRLPDRVIALYVDVNKIRQHAFAVCCPSMLLAYAETIYEEAALAGPLPAKHGEYISEQYKKCVTSMSDVDIVIPNIAL